MGNFLDAVKNGASSLLENKKSLISILIVGILIVALPIGMKLITEQRIFKSKAVGGPIVFKGDNVRQKADQSWVATKPQISLELNSPLGPPAPPATAVPSPGGASPSPSASPVVRASPSPTAAASASRQ